jgi:protocatechuate 3,4-dioxygenase beta subunit
LNQETGQPIARAQVRVGSETTTTDAEGRYTLTGLPPGQYVLSVTHPDYDPGLSSIFTLAAGAEPEVELTLYAPDTSPYPQDPMLTNPLDPNGAPTQADAE